MSVAAGEGEATAVAGAVPVGGSGDAVGAADGDATSAAEASVVGRATGPAERAQPVRIKATNKGIHHRNRMRYSSPGYRLEIGVTPVLLTASGGCGFRPPPGAGIGRSH